MDSSSPYEVSNAADHSYCDTGIDLPSKVQVSEQMNDRRPEAVHSYLSIPSGFAEVVAVVLAAF
jgi:hypothetical protein